MNSGWTGGQYSLFRALLGGYLFVHFAHLLPWATEVFSNDGMLPQASLSPLVHLFPNALAVLDAPDFVALFIGSAAIAALLFAAGLFDRPAALWMWYVLACLFGRNPLIANPALPYVGWMLLAHLFVPTAPYGSLAARARTSPAGGWAMPCEVQAAAWIVLAVSYSYSGYTKLLSPSWIDGSTLSYVLENPLARDWVVRDLFLALPDRILRVITIGILWLELLFAPLALLPRLRPWLWTGMLAVQFGFALLLNFADLTIAMLLFHLRTFDPAWIPARGASRSERVFFDGRCGLCHRVVRFVLAEDQARRFRLGPLQGKVFEASVAPALRQRLPDSFVVVRGDGRVLLRSEAVVHIMGAMGGLWRALAGFLRAVPPFARDAAYDFVGRNRNRLFDRPERLCPVVSEDLRERLLP